MLSVGGNITAAVQTKTVEKNEIGEGVETWSDSAVLAGWLDLSGSDTGRTAFNAKIEESTHYFICDYTDLDGITPENARMVINGKVYDILLIDTPMELNYHMEIYLKYVGGEQNVG